MLLNFKPWDKGALYPESIVKTAERNFWEGKEVITVLLKQRGQDISITEDAVKEIARHFDKEVMTVLLEQRGQGISLR